MNAETRDERLAAVDDELVALYVEQTQQSEWLVRVFLAQDSEPPTREQFLTRGVLASEDKLIDPYRSDPNDYAGDFRGARMGESE